MDATKIAVADLCLEGANSGEMDFPAIVGKLAANGFDGYLVDYRAGTTTYYLSDGSATTLAAEKHATPVPAAFDATAVAAAVGEAQRKVAGYTYGGFTDKVMAAGCAGYLVSISGRRVVYIGRSGETHVEHMPG